MRNFEALYHVPVTHRLVPVRSRSRGGHYPATYWEHEEYNDLGQLIARYESYAESTPRVGVLRSGWRKYDARGCLVHEGSELPVSLSKAA